MLSENIKVSEVSDILRKQLEGIDTRATGRNRYGAASQRWRGAYLRVA